MRIARRTLTLSALASLAGCAAANAAENRPFTPALGPRARVLVVNDLGGDIDGLFSTVHALLSTSTDVRGIVCTASQRESAQQGVDVAHEMLEAMRLPAPMPLHLGAPRKLSSATPDHSAGAQAIIDEAMRTDTDLPLYVTVGGGLTEVASALMMEPAIADKFTLVWIGGEPYPAGGTEHNLGVDALAVQYVFNETSVPIWQVPSNVYVTCMVSAAEIEAFVAPHGAIGAWLYEKLQNAPRDLYPINMGETWTLGDSPLVLLTALTGWAPHVTSDRRLLFDRTGSSQYDEIFAPRLALDGTYTARTDGRRIRVYRSVDNRMMLNDFFAKLRTNYG